MIRSLHALDLLIHIMISKVKETINKYNMLQKGDRVAVGVSGGADSMALLNILLLLKNEYEIDIAVAHIEHGIRGKESLDDALFVESFCNDNNIEFHKLSINAVEEAKEANLGVEEYSRNKRYEFFSSLGCDKIATAHNLTDNIETVVQRITRGTGLKGLCGIPPVRDNIIRPLINITCEEIRDYCNANSVCYRVDSTNLTNDYSRNFVRNNVLPLLKSLNSGYQISVNSLINDLNEDYSYIENCVDNAYESVVSERGISVSGLKKLDAAISKRIIKKYFLENKIELDRLHLEEVFKLLDKQSKVQIKGDFFAVSSNDTLRAVQYNLISSKNEYITQILTIDEFNSQNIDFYCDYDKINGDTIIRKRAVGDKISPANRNCTKSLKKLFNELSIPIEQRFDVDVVCDDDGVIGVIGFCTDERVKIDSTTKKVLAIKLPLEDIE